MSAICGILDLTGAPVSRELACMMQALAHRGLDGSRTWTEGSVAFGQQVVHFTSESRDEVLPRHDSESGLALTADVRLDNRSELCETLGVPPFERQGVTDSRLILESYRRWGEACPERLLGEFAFAIWDGRNRRLFCCRDHARGRPLFYHHDGRRFVFASEIKAILAVPGVPRQLDEARLALVGLPGAQLVSNEATLYRHVSVLPSAVCLSVDGDGIRKRRYWQIDGTARLPFKRSGEILEAFRALLFDVVRSYLRSHLPVTAQLSGGLDSSAIVATAARCLAGDGRELTVLSAVKADPADAESVDEREFIDCFRSWPNVKIEYVTAAGRGPLDDVERLVWGYDSPRAGPAHYLYTAFADVARAAGARYMLAGDLGELGPSNGGAGYLAELLLRLRWWALTREVVLRSRVTGTNPVAIVRSQVLRPILSPWLSRWLRNRTRHDEADGGLVRPAFRERHLAQLRPQLEQAADVVHRLWPDQHRNHLELIDRWQRKNPGSEGYVGYEHVRMGFPFSDRRLLEFCLAAPGDLKVRNGYDRYLVRGGLDGILPREIQWRTNKRAFSPDYRRRYHAQRGRAQEVLAAIAPKDPIHEVVDVPRLFSLATADTGRDAQLAPHLVPSGIYLICFLRQFPEFCR